MVPVIQRLHRFPGRALPAQAAQAAEVYGTIQLPAVQVVQVIPHLHLRHKVMTEVQVQRKQDPQIMVPAEEGVQVLLVIKVLGHLAV
jgi:hypothetical protein